MNMLIVDDIVVICKLELEDCSTLMALSDISFMTSYELGA